MIYICSFEAISNNSGTSILFYNFTYTTGKTREYYNWIENNNYSNIYALYLLWMY